MTRIPKRHLAALRALCSRLSPSEVVWAVTGSTGFALQGVPVQPGDIDVQTDRAGAQEIERLFADAVTRPVRYSRSDLIASHFGALMLHGVEVEIMGDIEKRSPDRSWLPPPDLLRLIRVIQLEELGIPVMDLAYEVEAYRVLGRLDAAAMLEQWMKGRGA